MKPKFINDPRYFGPWSITIWPVLNAADLPICAIGKSPDGRLCWRDGGYWIAADASSPEFGAAAMRFAIRLLLVRDLTEGPGTKFRVSHPDLQGSTDLGSLLDFFSDELAKAAGVAA